MQSSLLTRLHVGIIMDGNGRWAKARGLPRNAGHRGASRPSAASPKRRRDQGVGTLTLFAFSCDNWKRPEAEVAG